MFVHGFKEKQHILLLHHFAFKKIVVQDLYAILVKTSYMLAVKETKKTFPQNQVGEAKA